ncbi:hypothetical protein [Candidatus Babela massiliensis]|uniref:Uncharacterized protein n=1 Tax=Candidatus Babela massiliensis TaxID=673862 RepID=V6DJV5_9BACT|nr:hypothetical protein [Candidatus Babela massiliensis]CDK30796.1 hypothetical protein BABL1_gene_219 [Candidatus Babela massiliensis]
MLKKIKFIFLGLIFYLNFNNCILSNYLSDQETQNYRNKCYLLFGHLIASDLLTLNYEINKIKILGSKSIKNIKAQSGLGVAFNLGGAVFSPGYVKLLLHIACQEGTRNFGVNRLVLGSQAVDWVIPALSSFYLGYKEYKISKNAAQIAQYNKEIKRDLSSIKRNQFIWLGLNKLAPYVGYFLVRKFYDDVDLIDLFTTKFKNNQGRPLQVFEVLKALSGASEALRGFFRTRTELGNSLNYKKSELKNIKQF